jgi:radical SAM protein with 4Fe4S-binding SPASM domain
MSDNVAEYKPKALINQRQNLGHVLPLDTPFVVCIDICMHCNLKCKFCFHHNNVFTKQTMNMDLFKKVVDDLKAFKQKLKKLVIAGFGEVLMHPQYMDMLRYAVDSGTAERVESLTNGVLLTEELGEKITDAGLNTLYVSIESVTDEGYLEVAGKKVDVEKLASAVTYMYNYKKKKNANLLMYVKIVDAGLKNKDEEQRFYELFEKSCDYICVEKVTNMWYDSVNGWETEESKNVYGLPIKNNIICPLMFTYFVVHADGKVVPCCSDWNKKGVVGDLTNESAMDIWNSKLWREMRVANLNHKKDKIPLCKGCHSYDYLSPDNIDGYEDEILSRMGK